MSMWKWLKNELWKISKDERGEFLFGGGGDAPEQRPPTEEELELIRTQTRMIELQNLYQQTLLPGQAGGGLYQLALQTGQGYPYGGAAVGENVMPGIPGVTYPAEPTPTADAGVAGATGQYWRDTPSMTISQWGGARGDIAGYFTQAYGMLPQDAQVAAGEFETWKADRPGMYVGGVPTTPAGFMQTYAGAQAQPTGDVSEKPSGRIRSRGARRRAREEAALKPTAGIADVSVKPTTGIVGTQGVPDWYQQLSGLGGLMGLGAQQEMATGLGELDLIPQRYGLEATQVGTRQALAGGLGAPGEYGGVGGLGTPYGAGLELESALGQVYQSMQNRGLYGAGLVPALGTEAGARIAERTEGQRRQEQFGLLQLGLQR